jgi:5'-nucleotidase / UDP-sugar diphosphatase
MGYDFVAIGNHEFDFGAEKFAQIIQQSKSRGPIPQILLANYQAKEDKSDADFVQHFDDGTIQTFQVIEKNGFRIGIFAIMGVDAQESVPHISNLKFQNAAKTAKKVARYLKSKEKVDMVIALSHTGVTKNRGGKWEGEDFYIGLQSPDIDLIISGHSHTHLTAPVVAGNSIIVQAGSSGSNVGKIEVRFSHERKPLFSYQLVPMNDNIQADSAIQAMIDEKASFIENNILKQFDVHYNQPVLETGFTVSLNEDLPLESNLGPLLANSIYSYLNKSLSDPVDAAFVASGVIRNNIELGNTGKQNISDIFNVVPMGMGQNNMPGMPLGRMYVTAHELKSVLELILAVYPSKPNYFLFFSGLRITMDPHKRLFRKISKMEFKQPNGEYRTVSINKNDTSLYSIAANQFMLGFIGGLKKMSKGIVNVVPKNKNGDPIQFLDYLVDMDESVEGVQEGKEWIALLEYIRSFPDRNGNGIPDVPEAYKEARNPILFEPQLSNQ